MCDVQEVREVLASALIQAGEYMHVAITVDIIIQDSTANIAIAVDIMKMQESTANVSATYMHTCYMYYVDDFIILL